MPKRNISLVAAGLALLLAGPIAAQDSTEAAPPLDTVVATVNGTDILLGHIVLAKARLPQEYQQLSAEILFRGILDQLIQQTVLRQSFEGDMPERIALALENEERSLLAGEVVEGVMQAAVTDEALQALFDETYVQVDLGLEYNASHILLESEEEALEVARMIANGADFAETAREKSTGPSGPGGGSLGWFGVGTMVPAFEAAVLTMEVGDVSLPVQTQFGWHVIKLNDTRNVNAPEFDAVRGELEQELRNRAIAAEIEALLDAALVDRATADAMDPTVLDRIDVLDQK